MSYALVKHIPARQDVGKTIKEGLPEQLDFTFIKWADNYFLDCIGEESLNKQAFYDEYQHETGSSTQFKSLLRNIINYCSYRGWLFTDDNRYFTIDFRGKPIVVRQMLLEFFQSTISFVREDDSRKEGTVCYPLIGLELTYFKSKQEEFIGEIESVIEFLSSLEREKSLVIRLYGLDINLKAE